MPPKAILAETPGNIALLPRDVTSIKVERKSERRNEDSIGGDRDYLRITVEAQGAKREFNTDGENPGVDSARGLLIAACGHLVRWSSGGTAVRVPASRTDLGEAHARTGRR